VNDAVDRVLEERRHMSDGFVSGFAVSSFAHLFLVGGAFLASLLFPPKPLIKMMDGFAVQMPRGGGGAPNPAPPAPGAPKPAPSEAPPAPEPPPKVIKPPKEEPRKGLADPDAKKSKKKQETPKPSGGVPGATGSASQTPGLQIGGVPGPGVPGGTDSTGDWYLASVQQRIWMIWTRQIKTGFNGDIIVSFTILADGSVEDVRVQPSGVTVLDLAAQRAVLTAAPFGPLPKTYGTNRYPIQAVFKPTP
jgi:TonB family protein